MRRYVSSLFAYRKAAGNFYGNRLLHLFLNRTIHGDRGKEKLSALRFIYQNIMNVKYNFIFTFFRNNYYLHVYV